MPIILGLVFLIIALITCGIIFLSIFYWNLIRANIMRTLHLKWRLCLFAKKELPIIIKQFKLGTNYKAIFIGASGHIETTKNIFTKLGYWLWGMDIFIGKIPMIKLMIFCNIIMWIIK